MSLAEQFLDDIMRDYGHRMCKIAAKSKRHSRRTRMLKMKFKARAEPKREFGPRANVRLTMTANQGLTDKPIFLIYKSETEMHYLALQQCVVTECSREEFDRRLNNFTQRYFN